MNDELKKSESPDIAAGSMAYMPKPPGAPKDDNELNIDKKAEKKTMADIATELEPDDTTSASTSSLKISVNGEPKETTSPKSDIASKPVTKSLPPKSSHVADIAPVESHTHEISESSPTPKRSGGKGVLIFLLLIALIGAAALGYLWNVNRAKVAQLNTQLADLQSSKDALSAANTTQTTTTSASPTPIAAGLRLIPELGLTYKLNADSQKVTYEYSESTDSAGGVHSALKFSTTSLIAAERKVVTSGKYICTADSEPLGSLTSYKATDTVPNSSVGKFSSLTVDNKSSFKFGTTYYLYTTPQSTCSSDKTVNTTQTADMSIVKTLLTTLASQ